MKQLLITTHLYTFAVICVIATTISSCTFKKRLIWKHQPEQRKMN